MSIVLVILINAAALVAWAAWLRRRDRFASRKRPVAWLPAFLVAGAASLLVVSTFLYSLNPFTILQDADSGSPAGFLFMVAGVGFSEEVAKFLCFLAVTAALKSFREPLDAALHGATVGLGFAVMENLLYGLYYGPLTAAFRSLITISGHMVYAALSATAWGMTAYWKELRKDPWWPGIPFLGLGTAMILHGLYNSLVKWFQFIGPPLEVGILVYLTSLLSGKSKLSPYFPYPRGERAAALAAIRRGLALDPGNWVLRHREGLYLASGGAWERALAALEEARRKGGQGPYAEIFLLAARTLAGGEVEAFRGAWERLGQRNRERFLATMKSLLSLSDYERIAVLVSGDLPQRLGSGLNGAGSGKTVGRRR